ncbi:hypothetical protein DFH11DRAFT_1830179 [Phellopilus nigrolimitatus]|nr:hypothetical protein DFH11DRAFT_1830179 [Phellopilus nigrolimitatus]
MHDVVCTHYVMQVETCRRHPIASEHHGDVDVAHHTDGRSPLVSRQSRLSHARSPRRRLAALRKKKVSTADRDAKQDRGGFADDAKGIDMGLSKGQGSHSTLALRRQLATSRASVARLKTGPVAPSLSLDRERISPSPIDEDDDEQYDPMDDAQDELELGLDLQFCVSREFVAFMQKLLENTQVSQSVIVLSLHYIFRLKQRNNFTLGKPGSEFRVAVCALMLANKFVDNNTYTNKTWSDVSAIPLDELNKMEHEFLLGSGLPLPPHPRAPLLPDAALEVFTRISQPDSNRKIISSSVPQQWLWRLFEALVHRLPTDHDYKLVIREESWMSYLEKLVLDLYLLAFLMPPEMK